MALNLNEYYKKVYNVAFRLTGDELKSVNMAYVAISSAYSDLELTDRVPLNIFQITAKEICRLFLLETNYSIEIFKNFEKGFTEKESFQYALMSLEPLKRTLIVWIDVLGYKVGDMTETMYTKNELYSELNKARRLIKEIVKNLSLDEVGA